MLKVVELMQFDIRVTGCGRLNGKVMTQESG
jgi:hypothetical protein